jgi:hypothetical protein
MQVDIIRTGVQFKYIRGHEGESISRKGEFCTSTGRVVGNVDASSLSSAALRFAPHMACKHAGIYDTRAIIRDEYMRGASYYDRHATNKPTDKPRP